MICVVPQLNYRLGQVVFVAKRAQARRAQQEVLAGGRFQPQPTRGEYSQYVSARENQHVAMNLADSLHHSVSACSDLLR